MLLPTATIRIRDNNGYYHQARALIDSGSEATFISDEFSRRLGLQRSSYTCRIAGITGAAAGHALGWVSLTGRPSHTDGAGIDVWAIVLGTLTRELPTAPIPEQVVRRITESRIPLADEEFWKARPTDILLGAEVFGDITDTRRIDLGQSLPTALGSIFGFMLMGQVHERRCTDRSAYMTACPAADISGTLEKFWQTEELPTEAAENPDDTRCERQFRATTVREPNGRYVVRLPFRDDRKLLGDSWKVAFQRWLSTERKFIRNLELKEKYTEFIRSYIELGHMTECCSTDTFEHGKHYYIPHHGIFKASGDTSKIRVVFDGSCATSTGVSLND